MLIEPLGNWDRIGTEGAWFATIDMITQTRGDGLLCLVIWAFESQPSSRSTNLNTGLPSSRNSKKNTNGFFRTTLTKREFLLVGDFTQKALPASLDPHPSLVGSSELPWRSSRSSSGAFQIQNSKFTCFFVSIAKRGNHETTKRRNYERRNLLETADLAMEPSFRICSGP